MKKIRAFAIHALVGLAGVHGAAQAMAPAGVLPPSTLPQLGPPVAVPATQSGVISAMRGDDQRRGTQVEIAGRWLLVTNGRTVVLRQGLPAAVDALRVGQTVRFSMATTTPGETALGVVHVP